MICRSRRIVWILAFWLLAGGLGSAAVPAVESHQSPASDALPLDPAVTKGRLDNGLSYFVRVHRQPEKRMALWLAVNAGSMQEDDDQQGLAHFLEHMAFNGTRRFRKQEIVDYLETIGMRFGPDVNAYTSFDETVYMLEVPTDNPEYMEKAFLILHEWAQGIVLDPDEVEKERGVVLEERRASLGAQSRIRDQQFPVIFKGSRYAQRLPIGTEEVLKAARPEDLKRFYRDWYRPDLMAVIAVGDFDGKQVEKAIRERFGDLTGPKNPRPRVIHPVPPHEETLVSIVTDPEVPGTSVSLLKKLPSLPQNSRAAYRQMVIERLFHAMLNARLEEKRRTATAPFRFSMSQTVRSMVRSADILVQAAMAKQDQIAQSMETLLTEVDRATVHGFQPSELERAKKEMLRGYETAAREKDKVRSRRYTSEILRHFLVGEGMPGIDYELELLKELLPGIAADDLNAVAREWGRPGSRVVTVTALEGTQVPDEEALLALMDRGGRKVEAYQDQAKAGPLVPEPPAAGSIAGESRIPELGVTVWKLSNGVRVVLKPTDFKNDEILLSGFSPGGHSLASDQDYPSALYADSVVGTSGAGGFSAVELEKTLAGKVVRVSTSIFELEETVRGRASPQDMETMLQLIYLRMTAPRLDPDAIAAWKANALESVRNRLVMPQAVFGDRLQEVLSQNHLRRRPPTEESLGRMDPQKALEIYRERFQDAGDFTFVLVGNLDLEALRGPLLTYLGGLPTSRREEVWRDVGVQSPKKSVRFKVNKGLEPKSRVHLQYLGEASWSRQSRHDLTSLARVLSIRLREVLREDMGGTYGVRVRSRMRRRPTESYTFTISFGCAPENVDPLVKAALDEIEKLREHGVDDEILVKVREGQARSREVALKRNGFWLNGLAGHYRYGTDPRLILDYRPLVESVTSDRMRDTLRQYLNPERYVMGVLNPEKTAPPAE
ncbi:MAG: insulinase family protein [Acidobacteriota bacterium]|nr:insulinase family protein [Acidobacteriota bacterium]